MNDNLVGVSMHNATSIGVLIKQHDTSIKCILCSSIQCEHVMLVKQWPLDDPDIPEFLVDFMEQNVSTGYYRNSLIPPVSATKIPFHLTASLRDSFVNGPETIISKIEDDKGNIFLALIPAFPAINDDPCEACGSRFRDEDPREEGLHIKTVKMYGKRRIFDCYGMIEHFLITCILFNLETLQVSCQYTYRDALARCTETHLTVLNSKTLLNYWSSTVAVHV